MPKTESYKPYARIILIIVFISSSAGVASDADLKDNAYHYMKNGIDDQLYSECWHFDGRGDKTQFMLTFLLSDPDNLTSSRKIQVQAVVLQDGQPPLLGSHQSQGFGADQSLPMFDIGKSGFSSDQEGKIKVWGEAEETSGELIKWDLVYEPSASPWYAIPTQAKAGTSGWIKWLVYMPSANVTGSFTIGNRTAKISGTGYHDHIWGRFPSGELQIVWAQASHPVDGFSLSYMDIRGDNEEAFIGVGKGEEAIEFSGRQVQVNYTGYASDNSTATVYPASYIVSADNGDYSLDLNVEVQKSIPMLVDYQWPSPDRLEFQQIALLQGTLRSKSGEEYIFQELGFSGYATP